MRPYLLSALFLVTFFSPLSAQPPAPIPTPIPIPVPVSTPITIPISTPSPPNYQSCLQHRYARLLEAELTTLHEARRGNWKKFLPALRLGLAPALSTNGTVRLAFAPSLSLNSSLIYTAHRDKQQRAAQRLAVERRLQLQLDTDLARLDRLLRRQAEATVKLDLYAGVIEVDRQLFGLYQQQYDNHDITPEEYLLKRKAFLTQELRRQEQVDQLQLLQYEIEELAGCLTPALPTPLDTTITNFHPLPDLPFTSRKK